MKKKYLITGGAGFIGSHLAERLIEEGNIVTIVDDLSTGKITNLSQIIDNPDLKIIIDTVLNESLLERLIRETDEIFHLASSVGVQLIMNNPVHTIENIFQGTAVVFKYAARYRKKVLLTSTSEVYGKSKDIPFKEDGDRVEGATTMHRWAYANAKALDEFLALAYFKTAALPVVVVRLFNTVGPRQSADYGMVIPKMISASIRDKQIQVYGDGLQSRCFCHVKDVIDALSLLMNNKKSEGEVINVGSNQEISMIDLAKKIKEKSPVESDIILVPYEKIYPNGGFEDMRRRVPSIEKIYNQIKWKPKASIDDIIEDVFYHIQSPKI
jgi:UDP-glucose 4-epimerase